MRARKRYRLTTDTECIRRDLHGADTALFAFPVPGRDGCIPIYYTEEELEKMKEEGNFFIRKALEEGVEVFSLSTKGKLSAVFPSPSPS